MVFLGFVAFIDPLKEDAGESLELLRQAGVKLKVLTGDNEIVSGKICQQLGFQVYGYRRGRSTIPPWDLLHAPSNPSV